MWYGCMNGYDLFYENKKPFQSLIVYDVVMSNSFIQLIVRR